MCGLPALQGESPRWMDPKPSAREALCRHRCIRVHESQLPWIAFPCFRPGGFSAGLESHYSVRAGGQATEARFLRDSPVSCAMAVTESRGRRGLQFRSASGVAPWSVNPVADAKSIARPGRAVCVAGLQGGRIWPEPSQPSCNRIVESNDSQLIRPSTSAARHCAPGRQGGTSEATKAETRPCRSARVSGYNRGTGAQHERYPRGRDRHQARMACRIRRGHAVTTRPPAQVRIRTHAHTQAG